MGVADGVAATAELVASPVATAVASTIERAIFMGSSLI
jgi:hypothetical protein